ncbi:facilitated trehalose transporter Tret1-like [Galleria mellonella]|uniref:Facilitated trehalose transporter Tret1-like n=1 Tax=Galleria mellonella TaxID=7137 RepID=A0ABM3MP53_GALME|nr:facilitated trehalose transporter Tret1-like [Galleria mellonella]
MALNTWISPFLIQCFVTAGVSINMSGMGMVMGFTAVLLPQLRSPDSPLQVDDSSGSWIAAVPGFGIIVGNFIIPSIMSKYGRKIANFVSVVSCIIGWVCIVLSKSVNVMIVARFLQGVQIGMMTTLGPVLIGEYTSPKSRGMFLMTISVTISIGVFVIHTMGIYVNWQVSAYVCIGIAVVDMIIVILSPESPSWLAEQGRHEESKNVFRYLRGDKEEDELEKIIAASIVNKKQKEDNIAHDNFGIKMKNRIRYMKETVQKREFYLPVLIMLHVFTIVHWSGINMLTSYINELTDNVMGSQSNFDVIVITLDILRILSNMIGLVLVKKVRRRLLIFITIGINLATLLLIAGYTFAKQKDILPYDNPYIGMFVIYLHMFSIATGALPMAYVLAGEIFPLQYKGLCGGISTFTMSMNLFINTKTITILCNTIGFSGTYLLYSGVVAYCLTMVGILLPETKDRTLLEIEEEFRGKRIIVNC